MLDVQTDKEAIHLSSEFSVKHVFKLVHGDLCGPISPSTPAENKYFFFLVADFSCVMWIYMQKAKDKALYLSKI